MWADAQSTAAATQHDAVPEWSWPAMLMSFDVSDSSLVSGLEEDQAVDVVIEKQADGRHRIIEILPSTTRDEPAETEMQEMDHSGHDMGMDQ